MRCRWTQAVAGSGKTRTLCAQSLEYFAGPLFCISFSRSAVRNIRDGLLRLAAQPMHVEFLTVHSLAADILGHSQIVSGEASRLALETLLRKGEPKIQDLLLSLTAEYPNWYEDFNIVKVSSILGREQTQSLKNLRDTALQYVRHQFYTVCYDQILELATRYIRTEHYYRLPRHILVDEAQDLTSAQWELLTALAHESTSVYDDATLSVFGDPNQIIYSFQGSSRRVWNASYSLCVQKFGAGNLHIERSCYRCGSAILAVVNNLFTPTHVCMNRYGSYVSWHVPAEDKRALAKDILKVAMNLGNLEDVLILVRKRGVLTRAIAECAMQNGVGVSGITTPSHQDIRYFVEALSETNEFAQFQVLCTLYGEQKVIQKVATRRLSSMRDLIRDSYTEADCLLQQLECARHDCGGFLSILSEYITVSPELWNHAAVFVTEENNEHIEEFMRYCEALNPISTDPVAGCVRLLTIHAAKGLQARWVILADAHEDPYTVGARSKNKQLSSEEDINNLLYVCMTRAQEGLHVCGYGATHTESFAARILCAMRKCDGCQELRNEKGYILRK